MNQTTFTLSSQYLQQVIDIVAESENDVSTWLTQVDLFQPQLNQPFVTLPWHLFENFMRDALRLTGNPHFGLVLGERLHINMHGNLGVAVMSAATTRQVVEVIEKFLSLRTDLVSIEIIESPTNLSLSFYQNRELNELLPSIMEAVMLAIRNVLDFITLGACPIQLVSFAFKGDQQYAEDMFGCKVAYNQANSRIDIPLSIIDKPLKLANNQSFEQAQQVCQQELAKLNKQFSYQARIRKLLINSQRGLPSLNATARRFHLTPRTLHRYLINEGTSFRAIVEDVRKLLSARYLKEGQMTVKEVAYSLGYTDVANFRKAFKRWHGCSPSTYRAKL